MPSGIYKRKKGWTNSSSFKKGLIPWNRGKKGVMPTPWNKGISYSMKHEGQFKEGFIPWNKGLKWEAMSGKNHPNWKGGITPRSKHIPNNPEYKQWRKAVFERDNYRCMSCGELGEMQADHILRWADYPRLRYEINNGQTLCLACHKIKTKFEMRKNTQVIFATSYQHSIIS